MFYLCQIIKTYIAVNNNTLTLMVENQIWKMHIFWTAESIIYIFKMKCMYIT